MTNQEELQMYAEKKFNEIMQEIEQEKEYSLWKKIKLVFYEMFDEDAFLKERVRNIMKK